MYLSTNILFCLYFVAMKMKGVDLDGPGNINGVPVVEVEMESFEEKPWRKPGMYLCFLPPPKYFRLSYGHLLDIWWHR